MFLSVFLFFSIVKLMQTSIKHGKSLDFSNQLRVFTHPENYKISLPRIKTYFYRGV